MQVLSLLYDLVYTRLLGMRPSTHDVCRYTCENLSPFSVNKFGLKPRVNEDFRGYEWTDYPMSYYSSAFSGGSSSEVVALTYMQAWLKHSLNHSCKQKPLPIPPSHNFSWSPQKKFRSRVSRSAGFN